MLPWPWHFSAGQPIKSQRFAACLWAPPLVFRYLWQGRIRLWSPQPKNCKMCFRTDLDAKAQHFFERESMPRSSQVNRTIRTTPPGAGAAGAALAELLAGLVPGEKLAMGCWMLVAQAAPTVGESQDFKSVLARLFGIPRNRMVAGLERHILIYSLSLGNPFWELLPKLHFSTGIAEF